MWSVGNVWPGGLRLPSGAISRMSPSAIGVTVSCTPGPHAGRPLRSGPDASLEHAAATPTITENSRILLTPVASVDGTASLSSRGLRGNHGGRALPPPRSARWGHSRDSGCDDDRTHHQRRVLGEPAPRRGPGADDLTRLPAAGGRRH